MVNKSLSWNEISKFSFENPPNKYLGRELKIEEQYKEYKLDLKNKGLSSYEYIMLSYFCKGNKYSFQVNNFPYHLDKGIKHYVLWINPSFENEFKEKKKNKWNLDIIEDLICKELFGGNEKNFQLGCIYFQNLDKFRSIQTICHFQVFILTKLLLFS